MRVQTVHYLTASLIANRKTILVFTNSQCRIKIDTKHIGLYVCSELSDEMVSVDRKFGDRKRQPKCLERSLLHFSVVFSHSFKHTHVSPHY